MAHIPSRRPAGTFSLRTLLFAMASLGIAFGLMSWHELRPAVMPLAIAIPLYWCGAACMSFGSRGLLDGHSLILLGCVLMSVAVMLGFVGTAVVTGLWGLSYLIGQ